MTPAEGYLTRAEHEEFGKRMEDEHSRQNRRIELLETNLQRMNSIALSVEKLAHNMEGMLKEQEKQGERLAALEKQPAEKWNTLTRTLLTSAASTLCGGIVGALAAILIQ